jgi:hypothetical protein
MMSSEIAIAISPEIALLIICERYVNGMFMALG